MALRRPPTRVELKADDIEEYNEIMREREMIAEDAASASADPKLHGPSNGSGSSNYGKKQQSTAERIGIGRPR